MASPAGGDATPRIDDDEVPGRSPATHISGSHVRSATRSAKRSAGDMGGRDKVHGAGKRKMHRTKNVPPYKHMSEQLEKKLAKVEDQIREAQAMESKLLRKENMKEQQAERDIHGVEEEIKKVDKELQELEQKLVAQKAKYEEKDSANVKEFERKVASNRAKKTELQENIEIVQTRYHRIWRENYNLKMYHQMNSYWSRKPKAVEAAAAAPMGQQAMEDDLYNQKDAAAEQDFALDLEDGAAEDTAEADPFAEEADPFAEGGGTTGQGTATGTADGTLEEGGQTLAEDDDDLDF